MHKNFQFPIQLMLMIFSILFLPLMAAFGMSGHPEPVLPQMDKVETSLLEQIADRGTADYVVELGEKADLSAAETIPDWDERGRFVLDALKATAERTQEPVLAYLNENGLAHQSFFAGNEVMVFGGGRASIDALAALPAVAYIRSPKTIILEPEVPEPVGDPPGNQVNSLAWGIADTGADDFWSAFSFQGEGIVVANIDTGVQWDHPALDQAFKCVNHP